MRRVLQAVCKGCSVRKYGDVNHVNTHHWCYYDAGVLTILSASSPFWLQVSCVCNYFCLLQFENNKHHRSFQGGRNVTSLQDSLAADCSIQLSAPCYDC